MMKKLFTVPVSIVLLLIIGTLLMNPGCKKSAETEEETLTLEVSWNLQSINYSAQNVILIVRSFSLLFHEGGTVEMVVDCNNCIGLYQLGINRTIFFNGTTACTEVDCGQDSKEGNFHQALSTASRYEVNNNNLRIYFTRNGEEGHLSFSK
ncbi:MAG: META domain-containing protein [bacterium]|nr:META domain-containing protein [bacterium]